ncbi:four-carbon acid sugar kinase family protein [Shinella sp. G-2]|uniref:four-carbon acid sugar kinase family protein n=1 Tax=Shinella sp. G-2 TaxID=3133141 RepID=UPI003D088D05
MREIIDQIERVGIVADDLTSAADGAGAFLKSGYQPRVCRSKQETGSAQVTAIDTGSRLMIEVDAVRATAQAIASLAGCRHLYKTIDSTLRGHVRAEIAAAFQASGRARLVVAPAFPAAGRTTIDGVQRLHGEPVAQTAYGHDPVHPARTSRIADLIAPDLGRPAMVPVSATDDDIGKHIAGASVIVVDAYSQILLNRRIAEIAKHGPALWVGSPGMAEALAAVVGRSPDRQTFTPPNTPRRVLVLVGSANHVSHAQCEALAAAGASVADRAEGIATTASIACLPAPRTRTADPSKVLSALVDEAEVALSRQWYDAIIATGGETMSALMDRLSIHTFTLTHELEPGFPLGCTRLANGRTMLLAMKAGGFGSVMTLCNAANAILQIGGKPS